MSTQPITVLLADNHELFRAGLRTYLNGEEDLQIVGECRSVMELVRLLREQKPDVIMLASRLPNIAQHEVSCETLAKLVLSYCPNVRLILLADEQEASLAALAMRMGAQGFVSRVSLPQHIGFVIRAVYAGCMVVDSVGVQAVRALLDKQDPLDLLHTLTPREIEVLKYFAKQPDRGSDTDRQIAQSLGIHVKTVRNHIWNAMCKLEINRRAEIMGIISRFGLC